MEPPSRAEVCAALPPELGVAALGEPLGTPRPGATCWLASGAGAELVVKVSPADDRRPEKLAFAAEWLPRLAARGVPVPRILWHGPAGSGWWAAVQTRLPGEALRVGLQVGELPPGFAEDALALVELQADAGASADELAARDFSAWQEGVVFAGWGGWWDDAEQVAPALARRVAASVRGLEGTSLPRRDFTHNDLNLSNILCADGRIVGVVDWDELGFGTRAGDLVGLAFDCAAFELDGLPERLLAAARTLVGDGATAVLVAYTVLGRLGSGSARGWSEASAARDAAGAERILSLR
jgi:aminoglycoside phosphotransferase (APT) family kinase protein